MELTWASAFSTGGIVGHLAYILLITSMLMRQMVWLRLLVIASALVGILYSIVWLNDPVSSFWETLLVTVNVVQLMITWRQNRLASFSDAERAFALRRLRGLSPGEQRRLLDCGHWEDMNPGTQMTRQGGTPVDLFFISEGRADVSIDGRVIAECGAGSYVGEMSLIGDAPASATVSAIEPTKVWRISREALAGFDRDHPTWLAVIEAGIARDMRNKIMAQNLGRTVAH